MDTTKPRSEPFEFETLTSGSNSAVRIRGVLDIHTRTRLETALEPFMNSATRRLEIDMNGVSYLDSSGLAALVRVRRLLSDHGARLVLRDCSPIVQQALEVTRLEKIFEIQPA